MSNCHKKFLNQKDLDSTYKVCYIDNNLIFNEMWKDLTPLFKETNLFLSLNKSITSSFASLANLNLKPINFKVIWAKVADSIKSGITNKESSTSSNINPFHPSIYIYVLKSNSIDEIKQNKNYYNELTKDVSSHYFQNKDKSTSQSSITIDSKLPQTGGISPYTMFINLVEVKNNENSLKTGFKANDKIRSSLKLDNLFYIPYTKENNESSYNTSNNDNSTTTLLSLNNIKFNYYYNNFVKEFSDIIAKDLSVRILYLKTQLQNLKTNKKFTQDDYREYLFFVELLYQFIEKTNMNDLKYSLMQELLFDKNFSSHDVFVELKDFNLNVFSEEIKEKLFDELVISNSSNSNSKSLPYFASWYYNLLDFSQPYPLRDFDNVVSQLSSKVLSNSINYLELTQLILYRLFKTLFTANSNSNSLHNDLDGLNASNLNNTNANNSNNIFSTNSDFTVKYSYLKIIELIAHNISSYLSDSFYLSISKSFWIISYSYNLINYINSIKSSINNDEEYYSCLSLIYNLIITQTYSILKMLNYKELDLNSLINQEESFEELSYKDDSESESENNNSNTETNKEQNTVTPVSIKKIVKNIKKTTLLNIINVNILEKLTPNNQYQALKSNGYEDDQLSKFNDIYIKLFTCFTHIANPDLAQLFFSAKAYFYSGVVLNHEQYSNILANLNLKSQSIFHLFKTIPYLFRIKKYTEVFNVISSSNSYFQKFPLINQTYSYIQLLMTYYLNNSQDTLDIIIKYFNLELKFDLIEEKSFFSRNLLNHILSNFFKCNNNASKEESIENKENTDINNNNKNNNDMGNENDNAGSIRIIDGSNLFKPELFLNENSNNKEDNDNADKQVNDNNNGKVIKLKLENKSLINFEMKSIKLIFKNEVNEEKEILSNNEDIIYLNEEDSVDVIFEIKGKNIFEIEVLSIIANINNYVGIVINSNIINNKLIIKPRRYDIDYYINDIQLKDYINNNKCLLYNVLYNLKVIVRINNDNNANTVSIDKVCNEEINIRLDFDINNTSVIIGKKLDFSTIDELSNMVKSKNFLNNSISDKSTDNKDIRTLHFDLVFNEIESNKNEISIISIKSTIYTDDNDDNDKREVSCNDYVDNVLEKHIQVYSLNIHHIIDTYVKNYTVFSDSFYSIAFDIIPNYYLNNIEEIAVIKHNDTRSNNNRSIDTNSMNSSAQVLYKNKHFNNSSNIRNENPSRVFSITKHYNTTQVFNYLNLLVKEKTSKNDDKENKDNNSMHITDTSNNINYLFIFPYKNFLNYCNKNELIISIFPIKNHSKYIDGFELYKELDFNVQIIINKNYNNSSNKTFTKIILTIDKDSSQEIGNQNNWAVIGKSKILIDCSDREKCVYNEIVKFFPLNEGYLKIPDFYFYGEVVDTYEIRDLKHIANVLIQGKERIIKVYPEVKSQIKFNCSLNA